MWAGPQVTLDGLGDELSQRLCFLISTLNFHLRREREKNHHLEGSSESCWIISFNSGSTLWDLSRWNMIDRCMYLGCVSLSCFDKCIISITFGSVDQVFQSYLAWLLPSQLWVWQQSHFLMIFLPPLLLCKNFLSHSLCKHALVDSSTKMWPLAFNLLGESGWFC